jgi:transposase
MKYITITEQITEALKAVVKTDTRHKSRARAQAFLLNTQGVKIPNISKILDVSQRTLYRWFDRFDNNNINTIHELSGRGRKPALTIQEHKASVEKYIKKT